MGEVTIQNYAIVNNVPIGQKWRILRVRRLNLPLIGHNGHMTRCADGLARGGHVEDTAARAAQRALDGLQGRAPDVATIFIAGSAPEEAESALLKAAEVIGAQTVIGCTSDGVVAGTHTSGGEPAVSVWAASIPGARIRSFHLEVIRTQDSLAVVGMPQRREDDKVALMLADPWSFPAGGFVDGSVKALDHLPLLGGLAGGPSPGSVRMLTDGRVVNRGAVGLVLGGPANAHVAVAHSTRPVGPPMTVTSADSDVLFELAGQRAAEAIDRVVADLTGHDQALASAGLLVGRVFDEYADDHGVGDFAVQPVLEIDRSTGRVYVADSIDVGTTVRLHVIDPDSARDDIASVVQRLSAETVADGALVFYGSPRGPIGGDSEGDVLSIRRGLAATGVSAMLTRGAIGPVSGGNRLLGFATTMLILGGEVESP